MNSIENRCVMLDQEIDELKAEILGEYPCNYEAELLDSLIDTAMMLGEAYVYRDNTVTKIVKPEDVVAEFKED